MKLRDVLFWGGALIGAACSSTESGNPEDQQMATASPSVPVQQSLSSTRQLSADRLRADS